MARWVKRWRITASVSQIRHVWHWPFSCWFQWVMLTVWLGFLYVWINNCSDQGQGNTLKGTIVEENTYQQTEQLAPHRWKIIVQRCDFNEARSTNTEMFNRSGLNRTLVSLWWVLEVGFKENSGLNRAQHFSQMHLHQREELASCTLIWRLLPAPHSFEETVQGESNKCQKIEAHL